MVQIKGGDLLKAALDKISKNVTKAATVDVGFLEGATYPDGKPVAMIAAIQEYGAPSRGIPPRPFFRTMIAAKNPEWPEQIAKDLPANDYDGKKTLTDAGELIAGQLRDSIIDTNSPPLSPITVMLRGMRTQSRYANLPFGKRIAEARARVDAGKTNYGASTKPLVDTGDMLRAVDYVVKEK